MGALKHCLYTLPFILMNHCISVATAVISEAELNCKRRWTRRMRQELVIVTAKRDLLIVRVMKVLVDWKQWWHEMVWNNFVAAIEAPQAYKHVLQSQLALQLLMDRVLNKIKKRANATDHFWTHSNDSPLTMWEKSAIWYLAGYVAMKLLKRYRNPSKPEQVQFKCKLFVWVLKRMSTADHPDTFESLEDYTRLWSELIDRGGLYHLMMRYVKIDNQKTLTHCTREA